MRTIFFLIVMFFGLAHAMAQTVENITTLPAPEPSGRVIVFINGINSDPHKTFDGDGGFWPEMLRADHRFDRADVIVFPLISSFDDGSPSITNLADELRDKLTARLEGFSDVLFVAHSLGGIVVRKYLLDQSRLPDGGITEKNRIRGLFLFGTPMNGSGLANLGAKFLQSKTLWQLGKSSDADSFLDTLRDEWINANLVARIPAKCAYETVGVPIKFEVPILGEVPLPGRAMVVDADSASVLCSTGITGLSRKDHFAIVKPESDKDRAYILVLEWYQDIFNDPEADSGSADVMLANCKVDQYGSDLAESIANRLYERGITLRVSPGLPIDWKDGHKGLLLSPSKPKILLIHYSCFEDEASTNRRIIDNRNADFNALLDELAEESIKIVVYSRVFATFPNYLKEKMGQTNVDRYIKRNRLLTVELPTGVVIEGSDLDKIESKVQKLLEAS